MGAAQSKEISVKSNGIAGMMIADVIRNAGRIAQIPACSEAKNNDELLDAIGTRDDELFDHIGWPKGKAITMESKLQIVQQFLHWNIIGKRLEAINQLRGDVEAIELYTFITNLMDPPVNAEQLSVSFNREKPTMKYPDANVCANNLIIPLGNNSFEEFKESFSVALTNKFDYANV
ncbi:hypothetical protein KUTeg_023349 [Tegillarca granosa]|uniref:HECT domain-containing protein n=1 Tax=Tegillarca granosa TaxID=220873 RepID=A0ABQ9E1S4_TEGGR|nr:hypothetical protein KUTeg_023349 [Tegillarca granosa]